MAFLYARPKLLENFFVSRVLRLGASRRSVEGRRSSAIQVSASVTRLLVSVGLIYQSINRSVRGVGLLFEEKSGLLIRRI